MPTFKMTTLIATLLISGASLQGCFNNSTDTTNPNSISANTSVQNISNTELNTLMQQGVTLVDIRTPSEWQETGIIANSKPITLFEENGNVAADFVPKIQKAVATDKPVALICRSGNRTRAGTQILNQLGYKQIYNVTNGINAWIREGNPVTRL